MEDFEHPSKRLANRELDYKRQAVKELHEKFGDFVQGKAEFPTDDEARQAILDAINLTNFFNWRDLAYLDEAFDDSGDWLRLAQLLRECLRGVDAGRWEEPLTNLLGWLSEKQFKPAATKLLPTYFLFLNGCSAWRTTPTRIDVPTLSAKSCLRRAFGRSTPTGIVDDRQPPRASFAGV